MYKYNFSCTAVSIIVLLLFLTQVSTLTDYIMAQEQLSNQTEIVVAQTHEEKANLEQFDKL
jgi:hypothetical protein